MSILTLATTSLSTADTAERLLGVSYEDFINNLLPLYSGPQVTIRIGSTSHEYKLPKALLCKQSLYFKAIFEGQFQEGEEQSTDLSEEDGVVSTRSFQLLVQWLYLGRVICGELAPEEAISVIIEFVRIADMCEVTGMESLMAERIKAIITANPSPEAKPFTGRGPDNNTYYLTSKHITSAAYLPDGHPVRGTLAAAAVEGYLRHDNHRLLKEMQEVPSFSVDILKAVKATLNSLSIDGYSRKGITCKDPLSGEKLWLKYP